MAVSAWEIREEDLSSDMARDLVKLHLEGMHAHSPAESVFALESPSPNRIGFDLERVMRTKYSIDDFQQTYFVIDNFEKLLSDCYQDFAPFYERLRTAPDIEAHAVLDGDDVVTMGTLAYFRNKHATTGAANMAR